MSILYEEDASIKDSIPTWSVIVLSEKIQEKPIIVVG